MKFIYTPHFKFRAKQRKVSIKLADKIYGTAGAYYIDSLRKHSIVVASFKIGKKIRTFSLVYDIMENTIEFITIHEISKKEIENKLKTGRWQYEKN